MRSSGRWRASALMAALFFVGAVGAQTSEQKEGPRRAARQPARVSVDEIVERIMAFDKNKDGKVTRDELPERMHHLIAEGDTNKDGALDRDEIRKLATTLATAPGGFGVRSEFEVVGPGPGAPGPGVPGPGVP